MSLTLITLICGCNEYNSEYINTDYIQETKNRDFETNPSSCNISQLSLVCASGSSYYCTKWVIQPK